jgi:hypothetical protein
VEDLNSLDAKFHKEPDTAQDAFDREMFADADRTTEEPLMSTEEIAAR